MIHLHKTCSHLCPPALSSLRGILKDKRWFLGGDFSKIILTRFPAFVNRRLEYIPTCS
ncbi:hypothetical protein BO71DRAFT_18308 [Aspergillus ellipticus CBS 707.79]|uniref:Uncharacterized protein n=1 Tax=Aspergillus ellipticus CBS 707.79 TaxID=1448320 RepID=A0A319DEU9_9EURO|nr:hypothetical protein BO71DRAFT_18308 [Aspergillus ellipticus CBS 707.79]